MKWNPLDGFTEANKLYGHLGDSLAEKLCQMLQELCIEATVECGPTVSKKDKKADLKVFYTTLEIGNETYNVLLKDIISYEKKPQKLLKEYWNVYPIISEDSTRERLRDIVKRIKSDQNFSIL